MRPTIFAPLIVGMALVSLPARAQDQSSADTATADTGAATAAAADSGGAERDDLLTADELQALVGPVALYPDTLLMQIPVASTEPLEIV